MNINDLEAKITGLEVSCSIQLSYGRALENQSLTAFSAFHQFGTKAEQYGNSGHTVAHYCHTISHTASPQGGAHG